MSWLTSRPFYKFIILQIICLNTTIGYLLFLDIRYLTYYVVICDYLFYQKIREYNWLILSQYVLKPNTLQI